MLYLFEDCELDLARVVLRRQGTETRIEPQVFDLLCFLIELRGQFVRKEELLDQVWGDRFVSGSALTTRIKSARQAVGDDGQRQHVIRTVHGKGYEFVADVRVVDGVGVGVGVESATDASSRTAAAGPIRSAVPPALHALVGREALLQLLEHEMTTTRVVTLVGTGGVGKTTVAYELARRLGGNYRDGNYVVALSTVVDEDATGDAFATALDVYTRSRHRSKTRSSTCRAPGARCW